MGYERGGKKVVLKKGSKWKLNPKGEDENGKSKLSVFPTVNRKNLT